MHARESAALRINTAAPASRCWVPVGQGLFDGWNDETSKQFPYRGPTNQGAITCPIRTRMTRNKATSRTSRVISRASRAAVSRSLASSNSSRAKAGSRIRAARSQTRARSAKASLHANENPGLVAGVFVCSKHSSSSHVVPQPPPSTGHKPFTIAHNHHGDDDYLDSRPSEPRVSGF